VSASHRIFPSRIVRPGRGAGNGACGLGDDESGPEPPNSGLEHQKPIHGFFLTANVLAPPLPERIGGHALNRWLARTG